jgi:hypothetical protein
VVNHDCAGRYGSSQYKLVDQGSQAGDLHGITLLER